MYALAADRGREVDLVGDGVAVAGVDSDEFVALAHFHAFQNAQVFAAAALALEAHFAKRLCVRQGTAVEDGQLKIVQLDQDVIDARSQKCGKQMFGRGDEHALAHEAGGVADFGHVAAGGGDFKIVQIGAAEDHARTGRRREQAHANRSTAVKANAGELDRGGNCVFQVR